ncbi:hypothetical protein DPMN_119093 [Dreissena polymorpha]|uniref:DDE Tnp4 domain-containing protein n=1 Tax=Dreissena polymorpha TaxID=45954 RepID=A0A9D4GI74_DREPO|nr:hypothetical protein DPMN_119093 [Dreissena polymorpha]
MSFVPLNIGFQHVSRDVIIEQQTTALAQQLFDPERKHGSLVLDVKPMMVVSTTGYIVSILGPYLADDRNSGANILKHMISRNTNDFKNWIRDGDIVVVDRGFCDAGPLLAGWTEVSATLVRY